MAALAVSLVLHFGTPQQRSLATMNLAEAKRYLAEGHFGAGSMRPKIEACIHFIEHRPGGTALITCPSGLPTALAGRGGTLVTA